MKLILYTMMLAWSLAGLLYCTVTSQWVGANTSLVLSLQSSVLVYVEYQALQKDKSEIEKLKSEVKKLKVFIRRLKEKLCSSKEHKL